jgi:NAD(P)-dependent dehydrogenase (short-subunit alcohol dehydrogenase family)
MAEEGMVRTAPTILIVGASRGLGRGMAMEFLAKGWKVIATVRDRASADLTEHDGLEIEILDIDAPDQIEALRDRLSGRTIDIMFVNAGIVTREQFAPVSDVATDEFVRLMITNALSPIRVIEALQHLVPGDGLIGAMSSGQGSITNNVNGRGDVYRASKAALNMLMRSFAARDKESDRALLLLAPGWIRTDMGGPDAPFSLEESVPILVDLLLSERGTPGLRYLDRFGKTVPW